MACNFVAGWFHGDYVDECEQVINRSTPQENGILASPRLYVSSEDAQATGYAQFEKDWAG